MRADGGLSPIAPTDIVQANRPRVTEGTLPQIGGGGPGGQALRDKLGLTPAHDELYRYSSEPKGLAAADMPTAEDSYKIAYYAPQPRAVVEVVDFDDADVVVGHGQEGRVMLTTLTREFFVPRFMERDEGLREKPYAKYPWDGVSGVKPFRGFAATTVVGVY